MGIGKREGELVNAYSHHYACVRETHMSCEDAKKAIQRSVRKYLCIATSIDDLHRASQEA